MRETIILDIWRNIYLSVFIFICLGVRTFGFEEFLCLLTSLVSSFETELNKRIMLVYNFCQYQNKSFEKWKANMNKNIHVVFRKELMNFRCSSIIVKNVFIHSKSMKHYSLALSYDKRETVWSNFTKLIFMNGQFWKNFATLIFAESYKICKN